ncbi:MAG: prepilin-type N-terminal cleavage/methylation domain-containing protein [Deltaproteobacteria bacterium]|nr:prepilin-type N-terminal cleavage/methylation domain-containing protein [Deltaproteobacteria bacterium]
MVLKNQKGFTLIELLVVVAIIGILAAIAIPQFSAYRAKAFCSRAESDVKNTVTALEAFYVEAQTYSGFPGITPSQGVVVTPTFTATTITSVTGMHPNCDQNGDGGLGDTFTFSPTAAPQYSW